MKLFVVAAMVVLLSSEAGFSQQAKRPSVQPPRRAALQQVVLGFYITQLRKEAEVRDEVFVKVLPFLEQFVQDRFEIADRRRRTFNQLQKVINTGSVDDDVKQLVQELDTAASQIYSNQENFLRNVDPLLSTRQQARVRIFLDISDQRIRQMLNGIQNPAATPPAR